MKKKIILIVLVFLIFLFGGLLLLGYYISSVRTYSTNLTEHKFEKSTIAIKLPTQWLMLDVRKYQDNKTEFKDFLIVTGANPGGFPEINIYMVDVDRSKSEENNLEELINWDKARVEESKTEDIIILFEQPIDFSKGWLLVYKETSYNKNKFYHYELCKDWITIIDKTGYIISICEFEKHWDLLDNIYPDIIRSFMVLEE